MIVHRLGDWRRYADLLDLKLAYDFLERTAGARGLADGRQEIDGDRVYALVVTHRPKPAGECRFETHRRFADVVYIAEGEEMIGYEHAERLPAPEVYDNSKDVQFYGTPEFYTPVLLHAGEVAVFFPEDGHLPGARLSGEGLVRKVVVKCLVRALR